jgi:hypothetical protein
MSLVTPPNPLAGAPPRRRTMQRFLAWVLILFGAFIGLLGIVLLFTAPTAETPDPKEGGIAFLIIALVFIVPGIAWYLRSVKRDRALRDDMSEKAVLAVAARNGGRVTVAQVALETRLTMEEAETALNTLCGKNIAQPDILDDGTVVYTFGILRGVREPS